MKPEDQVEEVELSEDDLVVWDRETTQKTLMPKPEAELDRTTKELGFKRFYEREFRVFGVTTNFYGRREELETLYNAVRDAVNNRRVEVVHATGPSGIGKTRLVHEFLHVIDANSRDLSVFYTLCRKGEDQSSFDVFTQVLQQHFGITEHDDLAQAQDKLMLELVKIVEPKRLYEAAHLLGYVLQLKSTLEHQGAATAQTLQTRAFTAMANLLLYEASKHPVIIIIDNYQWVTRTTRHLLGHLLQKLADSQLLVILLGGQQPESELPNPPLHIDLGPLREREMSLLCQNILRKVDELPEELLEFVVSKAQGSPKMCEQLMRLLIQNDVISPAGDDSWVIDIDAMPEAEMPGTIQETAKLHVGLLTGQNRSVLEKAAIFGDTFWFGGVLSLMRVEGEQTEDACWVNDSLKQELNTILTQLQDLDIVRFHTTASIRDEIEFSFLNPLERQQLYGQIEPSQRAIYHRIVGQWFETRSGELTAAQLECAAEHFESGSDNTRAAEYLFKAANRYRDAYHNEKCLAVYSKALGLLGPDQARLCCRILLNLGRIYRMIGDFSKAQQTFQRIIWYSALITDRTFAGVAYNELGVTQRIKGEYSRARTSLEQALRLLQEVNDLRGIADAMDEIGKVLKLQGEYGSYKEALGHFLKSLSLRRKIRNQPDIALSLVNIGNIHLGRGFVREAEKCFLESLDIRKKIGDMQGVALSLNHLGTVHLEKGEYDRALDLWNQALQISEEIGDRDVYGTVLTNLGKANMMLKNHDRALTHLNEAVEVGEEIQDKNLVAHAYMNLATLLSAKGDHRKATQMCGGALAIAEEIDSKLAMGMALRTLGEVCWQMLTQREYDTEVDRKASESFQKGMSFLEEMGDELELAKCLESYGKFLLERGVTNKGRKHLRRAHEIFERFEHGQP